MMGKKPGRYAGEFDATAAQVARTTLYGCPAGSNKYKQVEWP